MPTYPDDVTLVRIRHTPVTTGGRILAGNLVSAVVSERVWGEGGSILPAEHSTAIQADGSWEIELPAVDSPGMRPQGAAYRVTEHVPGGRALWVAPLVAHAPGPVDLADVLSAPPAQGGGITIQTGPATDPSMAQIAGDPDSAFRAALDGAVTPTATAAGAEAAISTLADQPAVTDAAATRAVTVAADPAIAGALAVAGSATRLEADKHYAIPRAFADAVLYVSSTGADANDGRSPGKAKRTIQAAINAMAADKGTVEIGAGTYSTPLNLRTGIRLRGAGRRATVIQVTDPDATGITIQGVSGTPMFGVEIEGLWVAGPSTGTGNGIHLDWANGMVTLRDVSVSGFGGHGILQTDTYTVSYENVISTNHGGDGFHAEKDANHTLFTHCLSGANGRHGYFLNGGATPTWLNCDAEANQGSGFHILAATVPNLLACHMERNGGDGTSPNVYLHWTTSGSPTTAAVISGCLLAGGGITKRGLVIDGALQTNVNGNWFNNHVTDHVQLTANAARTWIGPNTYTGTGTELASGSASTARFDYDYATLIPRIDRLRFTPQAANPPVGAKGNVWFHDALGQMRLHDGAAFRTLHSGPQAVATLDFPSIPAGGSVDLTIPVASAVSGDVVTLGPVAIPPPGLVWTGHVSAAGVVTVRLTNVTATPIDPPASSWRVAVLRA